MKSICTSIICLLFISALFAQTNTDKQKDEINQVKKNKNYIYGEATLPDRDEALKLAKEILIKNINDWIEGDKKIKQSEAAVIRDIVENSENISLMRGSMYRAFIYVQKKNIFPVENTDNAVVLSRSTSQQEESMVAVSNIQKIESTETISETIFAPPVFHESDTPQDILNRIMAIVKSNDVLPFFQQLRTKNKIVYGKIDTLTSPEECYLLIYNKEGEVVAILDKGHNKNLRTQKEDSTKNYSGCGALWFKLL